MCLRQVSAVVCPWLKLVGQKRGGTRALSHQRLSGIRAALRATAIRPPGHSFIHHFITSDMVAAGNWFSGPTAQSASSVIAMRNAWDVQSDLQSETMDEDADASMQRLLAEAYDEFVRDHH